MESAKDEVKTVEEQSSVQEPFKKVHKLLYQMLRDLVKCIALHDVKYAAVCGTLIGAVRHKGIIPWDDDVDLAVIDVDEVKLLQLKKPLAELGLRMVRSWIGYRVFSPLGKFKKDYYLSNDESYPFIDIFMFTKFPEKKIYHWQQHYQRRYSPSEWFSEENWDNLIDFDFGDYSVKGFKQPNEYLTRVYTEKWTKPPAQYFSHSTGQYAPLNVSDFSRIFEVATEDKKCSKLDERTFQRDGYEMEVFERANERGHRGREALKKFRDEIKNINSAKIATE